jgi:hypothetical protein
MARVSFLSFLLYLCIVVGPTLTTAAHQLQLQNRLATGNLPNRGISDSNAIQASSSDHTSGHISTPAQQATAPLIRPAVGQTATDGLREPAKPERGGVKPLWPLDSIDVALLAIIMFSLSLAGGAGIGTRQAAVEVQHQHPCGDGFAVGS